MSELRCHFGKHEGKRLSKLPTGYLSWAVNKITDPRPGEEYQVHEDGTPMTEAEVDALEEQMRNFLSAAEDELLSRDET